jgi:hypothetical protein
MLEATSPAGVENHPADLPSGNGARSPRLAPDLNVAVIGAGPHGLSTAVHLRRAGVEAQVFGESMSFWRTMPKGMMLRSNWPASSIAETEGTLSLDAYKAETRQDFGTPIPLERFIEYGTWFQQTAVPDVDPRRVSRLRRDGDRFLLELNDGVSLTARRAVVACGIEPFAWSPAGFDHLPRELVSHTSQLSDLARFRGRRVAVVGGGQSALETAALIQENGGQVEVFIRSQSVIWLKSYSVKNMLGPLGPIVYAPTDVGPLWHSRLIATPAAFRRLPRRAQERIAYRAIRPACSHWARVRLEEVRLHLGSAIAEAAAHDGGLRVRPAGGEEREFDELVLGTGYRVDVTRYPFLGPEIRASLRLADGYPRLTRGLESSIPGLHFAGAPAAWSFGPVMRFVSGSWYSGRGISSLVAAGRRNGKGSRRR